MSWVKAHIGVAGNEAVDKLVGETSAGGRGSPSNGQEEGNQTQGQGGFGTNRTAWSNRALAAYTWYRTNKGPQHSWLHRINKRPDHECLECGSEETGEHIVRRTERKDRSWAKSKDGKTRTSRYGEGRGNADMMRWRISFYTVITPYVPEALTLILRLF